MTNLNESTRTYRSLPRRRYSRDHKRRLVQELLNSDSSTTLAQLARTHDIHPNLLGKWRRDYQQGLLGEPAKPAASGLTLLPVTVSTTSPAPSSNRSDAAAVLPISSLELRLRKGSMVLNGEVTADLLRDLVEALS
ncbi:IS66-like element accessory protein TnpA [Halopseudomonas pelagia]|uniref:IS66-like element accessory protein TnpA n=1 Tax=Halopseudomonas pelagia TaxID=553151 RepID=UPI000A01CDDF|nr:transposase [Halopseudomonas pelagia]